jgi:hypothetical protein
MQPPVLLHVLPLHLAPAAAVRGPFPGSRAALPPALHIRSRHGLVAVVLDLGECVEWRLDVLCRLPGTSAHLYRTGSGRGGRRWKRMRDMRRPTATHGRTDAVNSARVGSPDACGALPIPSTVYRCYARCASLSCFFFVKNTFFGLQDGIADGCGSCPSSIPSCSSYSEQKPRFHGRRPSGGRWWRADRWNF